jgi:hypothetical protein
MVNSFHWSGNVCAKRLSGIGTKQCQQQLEPEVQMQTLFWIFRQSSNTLSGTTLEVCD